MRRALRNWLSRMIVVTVLAAVGLGAWPQVASAKPRTGPFVGTYVVYAPDVASGPLGTLTLSPDFDGQLSSPNSETGFIWVPTYGTVLWDSLDPSPESPFVCAAAGLPILCRAEWDFVARRSPGGFASQKHPGTMLIILGNSTTVDRAGWWAVRTS
jgi:hypothetical protein